MAQTTVQISGEYSGCNKLRYALIAAGLVSSSSWLSVTFPTKREAKKALWGAYKALRANPDNKGILSYSKFGALRYDASTAEIK